MEAFMTDTPAPAPAAQDGKIARTFVANNTGRLGESGVCAEKEVLVTQLSDLLSSAL